MISVRNHWSINESNRIQTMRKLNFLGLLNTYHIQYRIFSYLYFHKIIEKLS